LTCTIRSLLFLLRFTLLTFFCFLTLDIFFSRLVEVQPSNPCEPSPCGPNSQCRAVNGYAVCSCLANFVGSPPACRPECVVSSECPQNQACINQRCGDPCPGTCGTNARCQVVNHNPICSCPPGNTGDPFVRCVPEQRKQTSINLGCGAFTKVIR